MGDIQQGRKKRREKRRSKKACGYMVTCKTVCVHILKERRKSGKVGMGEREEGIISCYLSSITFGIKVRWVQGHKWKCYVSILFCHLFEIGGNIFCLGIAYNNVQLSVVVTGKQGQSRTFRALLPELRAGATTNIPVLCRQVGYQAPLLPKSAGVGAVRVWEEWRSTVPTLNPSWCTRT